MDTHLHNVDLYDYSGMEVVLTPEIPEEKDAQGNLIQEYKPQVNHSLFLLCSQCLETDLDTDKNVSYADKIKRMELAKKFVDNSKAKFPVIKLDSESIAMIETRCAVLFQARVCWSLKTGFRMGVDKYNCVQNEQRELDQKKLDSKTPV